MLIGWPTYFFVSPLEICWPWGPWRTGDVAGAGGDAGGAAGGCAPAAGAASCGRAFNAVIAPPGITASRGASGAPLAMACASVMVSAPSMASAASSRPRASLLAPAVPAAAAGPWNTTVSSRSVGELRRTS